MTNKKYQIILADPPWKYNSKANHKTRFRGGAEGHYKLMTMEEIKRLPIKEIADDNAVLLLWTTFPYLKEQLDVFEAWGFKYKTLGFLWTKLNPKNGKPFFGVGFYSKSNAEMCLLGTRGRVKPITNSISQIVVAPRGDHSQKPIQVKEKIVELFGDLPRLELFARQKTEGWDVWGNEVNSDIEMSTI